MLDRRSPDEGDEAYTSAYHTDHSDSEVSESEGEACVCVFGGGGGGGGVGGFRV